MQNYDCGSRKRWQGPQQSAEKAEEEGEEMTITIVLLFLPPSLNRVAGRGPYNYREAKERFTEQVRLNCLNYRPKTPIDRATVTIRYYFPDKRRRDPDNYSGKFLLDGLTKAGIIVDDSFNHITLRLEAYCDPARPRTEIIVEEVPNV